MTETVYATRELDASMERLAQCAGGLIHTMVTTAVEMRLAAAQETDRSHRAALRYGAEQMAICATKLAGDDAIEELIDDCLSAVIVRP
jgi:hypothetical protein